MPHAGAQAWIADVSGLGEPRAGRGGVALRRKQRQIGRVLRRAGSDVEPFKWSGLKLEVAAAAPVGCELCACSPRILLRLIERDLSLHDSSFRTLAGEQRVKRSRYSTVNLGFDALRISKALLGNRDRCVGGESFNPGNLNPGKHIQHAKSASLLGYTQFGPCRVDARLPLATALERALIPCSRLRPLERRIGSGAREIFDIDANNVARPNASLSDRGARRVKLRGGCGDGWVAGRNSRKRIRQGQVLPRCRLRQNKKWNYSAGERHSVQARTMARGAGDGHGLSRLQAWKVPRRDRRRF
jgi:hypothetical protein